MIETYSIYKFEVLKGQKGWFYVIYDPNHWPCDVSVIVDSEELYDSKQVAYLSAIGNITLLEKEASNEHE